MTEAEIIIRLLAATSCGIVIGLDRELRGISAGIRTHGLVGLSSAAITLSALLLYEDLHTGSGIAGLDPLRVIQGLAQAIGFIAAGTIFFSRGEVHNLTSAANLWLAATLGIAAGAGQYILLSTALFLGILLVTAVRVLERFISPRAETGRDRGDDDQTRQN